MQPLYNRTSQHIASKKSPERIDIQICRSGVKINEQTGSSAATLNQFVTEFRSASITLDVGYPESATVVQAPMYDGINRARLYSLKARKSPHPGPAVMRVGKHLAVVCLFFGAAFAAFVSGSLDQRIGNLFFFGLIPAIGFYAGGHVLGQVVVLGVELCDIIMARCFRYVVRLLNDLLSWAGTHVSNWYPAPFSPPSSKVRIPRD